MWVYIQESEVYSRLISTIPSRWPVATIVLIPAVIIHCFLLVPIAITGM
jgi:hypothetical protein